MSADCPRSRTATAFDMDTFQRLGILEQVSRSLGGAGKLRLVIQPVVAFALGVRLGIADAKENRPPFVVRVAHVHGVCRFRVAVSDVVVPMCVAFCVDIILQYYSLHDVRLISAAIVAVLLVWLPFAAARGFTNRVFRSRKLHEHAA